MVEIGKIYQHFKGNKYKVILVAKYSENEEDMVVYQAMYGNHDYWVRPLSMFTSKVDKNKYPNVAQEYRFEKID